MDVRQYSRCIRMRADPQAERPIRLHGASLAIFNEPPVALRAFCASVDGEQIKSQYGLSLRHSGCRGRKLVNTA
jgi:hypothetical protein